MHIAIAFAVGLILGALISAVIVSRRQELMRKQLLVDLTELKENVTSVTQEKKKLAQKSADMEYQLNEAKRNQKALEQRLNK
jgi:uncharacterized membrane protein YciS (DUF1049 family)